MDISLLVNHLWQITQNELEEIEQKTQLKLNEMRLQHRQDLENCQSNYQKNWGKNYGDFS